MSNAAPEERRSQARSSGSPVARAALLAYLLLIIYASWFPFSGWRFTQTLEGRVS